MTTPADPSRPTPAPSSRPPSPEEAALRIDLAGLPPDEAVAQVLEHGAQMGVSDLFLVSQETHVAVMARHLGILRLVSILPLDLGRRAMAHVKALSNMDVAERRRPLDGRWLFKRPSGETIDLRINMIPTLYGEDFALRLLARDSQLLGLENLGLLRNGYNHLIQMLDTPGGLILVTGPTGSGKTTTLYACLNHLNNGERKINTIEDPIEYALLGVRQSQIAPRLDVGFPELLRSVLRQAPDVIMIGEIRDPVTAETAVRAASSGHLVLATLHAPIAAGAIQTLLSLGVHPHFLASSVLGVVAQRLVRTLCRECRTAFDLGDAPEMFDEVKRWLDPSDGHRLYGPVGCAGCRMAGYSGRTGVFEVMPISRDMRKLIMKEPTTQQLHHKAVEEGMIQFRHSALIKVAKGETSPEEVFRAVPAEHLQPEE